MHFCVAELKFRVDLTVLLKYEDLWGIGALVLAVTFRSNLQIV